MNLFVSTLVSLFTSIVCYSVSYNAWDETPILSMMSGVLTFVVDLTLLAELTVATEELYRRDSVFVQRDLFSDNKQIT